MSGQPLLILGCGIFSKEIKLLIEKNHWQAETAFLDSALHNYLDKLARGLTGSLAKRRDREVVVFYGCCHPLIDRMVAEAGAVRVAGQNCVEMLLGRERFDAELEEGAFFLLEEWALRWPVITRELYGKNPEILREVFAGDRRYILAVRTPCSGDFAEAAVAAAESVGLPLRWTDCGLDHLEGVLAAAILRRREEAA